ncbi:acetolactate decarboxylase [Spiroplasma clarkii]|uniref:Alpha-acetolactate decarboxylase n=1 Tax=Spiroplasma clarkii TaxID=2139 RepID=A0A1Y0L392_9MOLU|nr:acetolactate decarboxylase [Spiroplasma clarkii]ARU92240.1 acetolactate decarboxylase [Spiroplasma clarkii]ATX71560.1 acetolactate decarboxylase [Spiroplasma clarkii]
MPTKLFQYSTITSLVQGNYEGEINYVDFKDQGDFGLGTFDSLDGEMIVLNGVFYQLLADGSVNIVDQNYRSPFLSICKFTPETTVKLTNLKQPEVLDQILNSTASSKIIAIKIEGEFEQVSTRTVRKQVKPYKKMFEINDVQSEMHFQNQTGTIVGFYTPRYLNTIGVEGVHFHFLTSDLNSGGHVLNFTLKQGTMSQCTIAEIALKLGAKNFDQTDVQAEIKKLEGHND